MPIPLIKVGLTTLRYILRPINNLLIKKLKNFEKDSLPYQSFVRFGQATNRMEIKMNRILLGTKGLGEIKEIHADMAFNKGVEWFTELVFFYGILFVITAYEFKKADIAS